MSADNYKIFISLSHRRIAFEYWQRNGEDKLTPFPNGTWPAPLAFFCSNSRIIIGEDAARAAHHGTDNAFDNYFEILSQDKTYSIGGQTKPIRNILLDASEQIFRNFYREVLLNQYGSLEDNRSNMPLTIVCEADIKHNERAFLAGLFQSNHYSRVEVVDYNTFIEQYIRKDLAPNYHCSQVVVAWTEGKDLSFTLFDINGKNAPQQTTYSGLGIDPRKEYVKRIIWERVNGQNPYLQRHKEEESISKAADDFLISTAPLVRGSIILSDNNTYYYDLNRNNIDYLSSNETVSVKSKLDEFLRANGVTNYNNALLLLRGIAAHNNYFELNLSRGFAKTIKSNHNLRNHTMQLLIQTNAPTPTPTISTPTPKSDTANIVTPIATPIPDLLKPAERRWREVRAAAKGKAKGFIDEALQMLTDFFNECQPIPNADNLRAEIKTEIDLLTIAKKAQPQPLPHQVDTVKLQELNKKWREVKATAKGKARSGCVNEAIDILQEFVKEADFYYGFDELVAQVRNELDQLTASNSPKQTITQQPKKITPKSTPPKDDEGNALIKTGRLKEARDCYRAAGNNQMAQTLSTIIRSQKSVEMRKAGIVDCRQTKDKVQITRIIKELEEYLSLCSQAGVDASEIKKLLTAYKRIKST